MIRFAGRLLAVCAVFILPVLLSSLAVPAGAFVQLPSKERMNVRVTVTKNFGDELVFDKEVETRVNSTAGDALALATDVEMSGDYVETIAGIKGDQQVYWFYYINGLLSKVFAHGYKLQPGDVVNWDFHDWTFYSMGPSAVLGAFPEPCLGGYGGKVAPTTIVFAPEFENEARELKDRLAGFGVAGVMLKEQNSLTIDEKQLNNLFIIAAADQPLIASLNEHFQAHEPVYFSGNQIRVRDFNGKDKQTFGTGYGVLNVIQNPWNPKGSWACQGAVWAVTGLDETGVRRAARVLIEFPKELSNSFALVAGEGEVIKTPIGPGGSKILAFNTGAAPAQETVEQVVKEDNASQAEEAVDAAIISSADTTIAAGTPVSSSTEGSITENQPPASSSGGSESTPYEWALFLAAIAVAVAGVWCFMKRRRNQKEDNVTKEQKLI